MKRLNLLVVVAMVLTLVGMPQAASAAATLYVNATTGIDSPACTLLAPCKTIQRAISNAAGGDTINVAAGTYTEIGQIVIGKNLTIVGADKTTTIIKPAADTGSVGDARGWWLVNAGFTFNLSNVTLDGTGKLVNIGILSHGPGTIQNNIVQNIGYNPSGPDYAGRGIAFYDSVVTIANNTLSNIGRIGIYLYGALASGSVISGNTYVGKGNGNWLDYAIELEGGANAAISGNTISGCTGVASVDHSTSAGILLTTYFAAGTGATITGNTITGNTIGIAVGYDSTDTSTVVAHDNIITGNASGGIESTNPPVNAENNWWGCSSGPGNPGCDSAIAPVDFAPWEVTPWLAGATPQNWTKSASNPVAANICGVASMARPQIVWESTNHYKMYFTNHGNWASTYLATTSDGGLHWTCATGGAPVLTTGGANAWDEVRASGGTVVKDGANDYKMWYGGRNSAGVYVIGYATSTDGVTWNKYGSNPLTTLAVGLPSTWDSTIIREMNVVHVAGGLYHMWYSGAAVWPYFKIGHATSPDGITWTKDAANPVLSPTAGSWDASEVYAPSVVWDAANSQFVMFYSGSLGNPWLTGYASSRNGTVWTKAGNAILSQDGVGSFDLGDSTDYVGAVLDGTTWKLFYSGGPANTTGYQIGLMTLSATPQLTLRQLSSSVGTGSTVDVYVDLNAVSNMYGYQFIVNFDQTMLSARGMFVNSFFDTTPPNAALGWAADCTTTAGQCKFAATKQSPATALTGSGPLAKITFTGGATPGLARLQITDDILSTKDADVIPHTKTTGWINVFGTATINGVVNLQGRSTPTDATGTVTLYAGGGAFPPVVAYYGPTTGAWTATVPVDGSSTTYALAAAHGLYLTNQLGNAYTPAGIVATPGGTFTAATTKLLGGDANNSGKVYLEDLACIGGAFGGAPTTCGGTGSSDINGDGSVNILDLVLAGGNYDLSSTQPW